MKFADYPRVSSLRLDDLILIDGTRGTKSVTVENAIATLTGEQPPQPVLNPETLEDSNQFLDQEVVLNSGMNQVNLKALMIRAIFEYGDDTMAPFTNELMYKFVDKMGRIDRVPYLKNCIYRGEFLGDSIESIPHTAISSGRLDNIFIGDYWVITYAEAGMEVIITVADFNYYPGVGPHLVFIIDTNMPYQMDDGKYNQYDKTSLFKYLSTEYITEVLDPIFKPNIEDLVAPLEYINTCATMDTQGSIYENDNIAESKVWLLSQTQLLGYKAIDSGTGVSYVGIEPQLALFKLNPTGTIESPFGGYWLRDFVMRDRWATGEITDLSHLDYICVNSTGIMSATTRLEVLTADQYFQLRTVVAVSTASYGG